MRAWRLARPARAVPEPRRVLLVQLDHLGDAVLTSPFLSRLRRPATIECKAVGKPSRPRVRGLSPS